MVVNAVVAVGLALTIGFVGAGAGDKLRRAGRWSGLLLRGKRRMGTVASFDDRYRHRVGRIVLAAMIMGVCPRHRFDTVDPAFWATPPPPPAGPPLSGPRCTS